MKVNKQSLVDWQVTADDGKHIAWITKSSADTYLLTYTDGSAYPFINFKAAKDFVAEQPL